jgi:putative membrane protein
MKPEQLLSFNLTYWFLQTIAMAVTALIIPRLKITSVFGALGIVIALAFVNSKVWDAALFLSIPDSFSMRALLLLVTNGVIFWVLVKLLPGIETDGFLPALAAPVVFTVCSLVIGHYGSQIDWAKVLDFVIDGLRGLRSYLHDAAAHSVNQLSGT